MNNIETIQSIIKRIGPCSLEQLQAATALAPAATQRALNHLVITHRVVNAGTTKRPSYKVAVDAKAPPELLPAVYEPWHGTDWSTTLARPGCQDHLKWPSRVGDRLIYRRAA